MKMSEKIYIASNHKGSPTLLIPPLSFISLQNIISDQDYEVQTGVPPL